MPAANLKKLFGKEARLTLGGLLEELAEPVGVMDLEGKLLFGAAPEPDQDGYERIPILWETRPVGWVVGRAGSKWPSRLAPLMEFLAAREAERKDLAAAVLDNYRELHLLYRLSEKLVATLEPEAIASTMLNEVGPLARVEGGMVVHNLEGQGDLNILAAFGSFYRLKPGNPGPENIIARVIQTGIADLANGVDAGEYFQDLEGKVVSLLCAPLKTEKRNLGAIIFVGDQARQFTASDLKLVNTVAMQTAPAIEIAHLHQLELEKVRLERDLQTARQVQSGLLPDKMPKLEGWRVSAYWQPARAVGGDFYEFMRFSGGKLGLAIADATDKGVPAALMMANTRSVLRAVAATTRQRKGLSPGRLLAQVNNLLCEDIPAKMFVTCLLMILDPISGQVTYANAGHNLAYLRTGEGVHELRATGVPLGLFPGMVYEDKKFVIGYGESVLMYSDGLVEAHNAKGEMFGTARLRQMLRYHNGSVPRQGNDLIQFLLAQLAGFTGPNLEQEDDVTLLTLERCPNA